MPLIIIKLPLFFKGLCTFHFCDKHVLSESKHGILQESMDEKCVGIYSWTLYRAILFT